MILELDTSLLNLYDLSLSQLVFINLVLNENQNNHQDVHELLSRVSDVEIQDLIQRNIVVETITDNNKIYKPSEELSSNIKKDMKDMFDEFYEVFPVYVIRPDGTKGFLRSNVNKCRKEYNRIIGRSRAMHEYLLKCLNWEISTKTITGKIGYMKTMWKWLTQHEWECYEEQMQSEQQEQQERKEYYGTTIL